METAESHRSVISNVLTPGRGYIESCGPDGKLHLHYHGVQVVTCKGPTGPSTLREPGSLDHDRLTQATGNKRLFHEIIYLLDSRLEKKGEERLPANLIETLEMKRQSRHRWHITFLSPGDL